MVETASASPGRREEAKAERRKRIVLAARDLIRETGDAGLSMRALAARAGVSLATPYNLFGSKAAVLLAVLEDIKGFRVRFADYDSHMPLDRLLKAAALAVSYYVEDPEFYRALWTSVLKASAAEERRMIFNNKRKAFWLDLLGQAQDGGWLADGIATETLLSNLDFTFRSVMLHWINGELGADGLQSGVGYGYALALRGASSRKGQALMLERVLSFQHGLADASRPRDTRQT